MANICTNRLYLSTKDRNLRDALMRSIRQLFRCESVMYCVEEVFECEIEFDSRWIFLQEEMEELTKDIPEGNGLCISVISHEFGCEYVGFNIYADGEWQDKLADK